MEETLIEFMIRKGKEAEEHPRMLEKPLPEYKRESSKYPEQLRVCFEDGHTAVYELRVEQPAPVIIENMKCKQGYVNKPLRRRGRI